jgi:uncharacterized protein
VRNRVEREKEGLLRISGSYTIDAPREEVWAALHDTEVLARSVPGCERLEQTGDNEFVGTVKIGIQAIKGTYSGRIRLEDIQAPHHYKLVANGRSAKGVVDGAGTVDLTEEDGKTTLKYDGDAQIGGMLASVGQRLIEGASKQMINQSLKALTEAIALRRRHTPVSAAPPAPTGHENQTASLVDDEQRQVQPRFQPPVSPAPTGHENQTASLVDDEQRQQFRELLRTHQSRLRVLELQHAQQGIQTPAHIITEIDDIRRQIARVTAQLMTAIPARTREQQRKLRADAFKVYHRRDWAVAEDLLSQALFVDPDDHEVRERLRTVQQRLDAEALYQAIRELRTDGLWQAVLDALDDLVRERPEATDPDGLRAWAEGRKQWEEAYTQARQARAKGDWQLVHGVLGALTNQQREDDPERLWAWADQQQRLSNYYREARFARRRGDWQEVLKLLNERAADDPAAPDSGRLGEWAEQERQRVALYDAAITALETLLSRFPDETTAREALQKLQDKSEKWHSRSRAKG